MSQSGTVISSSEAMKWRVFDRMNKKYVCKYAWRNGPIADFSDYEGAAKLARMLNADRSANHFIPMAAMFRPKVSTHA